MVKNRKNRTDIKFIISILSIASVFLGSRLISFSLPGFELYPLRLFSLMGLFYVIIPPKKKEDSFVRSYYSYSIAFILIAFISILWVTDVEQGVKEFGIIISGIILTLQIVYSINSTKRINYLIGIWIFGAIFVNLLGVWEIISQKHILAVNFLAEKADERLMDSVGFFVPRSIFSNQNNYAYFNSVTALVLLGRLVKPYKPVWIYWANIFSFILSFFVMLFSYSRGGILGFFVGATLFFIFSLVSRSPSRRSMIKFVVAGVCICILILFIRQDLFDSIGDKINALFEKNQGVDNNVRVNYYMGSLNFTLDHLGIGMGPGSSITALNGASPHNHFLLILVEYGVVILGGLLWVMYKCYRKLTIYGKTVSSPFPTMLKCSLLAFPLQMVGPSSITGEGIYWLWLGFLIAYCNVLKENVKFSLN